jgi:hypothetical protein
MRALCKLCATALVLSAGCSEGAATNDEGGPESGGTNASGGSGASGGTGAASECIPGSTEVCTGMNGCSGARVCDTTGSAWSACDCGTNGGAGGTSGSGGSATAGTSSGGTGGSGAAGGSAGKGFVPLPACTGSCNTAADCGAGTAADDQDNYRCDMGVCIPLGCNNDTECAAQSPGAVCRPYPALGRPTCQKACNAAGDCANATPAFDADNVRCTNGACEYTGCNNSAECEGTFPGMTAVCFDEGTGIATCHPVCSVPADCSLGGPLVDGDNYRCDDGICIYLGCHNDAECAPALDICLGL